MNHDTQRNLLVSMSLAVSLTGALACLAPGSARAACKQWDLSQPIVGVHGDYTVHFNLRQQGSRLGGKGWVSMNRFDQKGHFPGGSSTLEGPVTGSASQDSFEVNAPWGGIYVGFVDPTGRIQGYTYDPRAYGRRVSWSSDTPLPCKPVAAPAQQVIGVPSGERDIGSKVPGPRSGGLQVFVGQPRPAPVATAPVTPAPASPVTSSGPTATNTGFVPPRARGGGICKGDFVHRLTSPADSVCVTQKSQARVAEENRLAASRRQPGGGAYGANTCRIGYVWREALAGDTVCVRPAIRTLVARENGLAQSRVR